MKNYIIFIYKLVNYRNYLLVYISIYILVNYGNYIYGLIMGIIYWYNYLMFEYVVNRFEFFFLM